MMLQGALPRSFYQQATAVVARELLGKVLVVERGGIRLAGRIVETEAYLAENDAACHAHRGKTPRNAPMFAAGGVVYVYRIYGVHWCCNVVTETEHRGCAVLIRAVEPLEGIEEMARRRGIILPQGLTSQFTPNDLPLPTTLLNLCNGPGKLAQALGFTANDNLRSLQSPELCIVPEPTSLTPFICGVSARVGITKARELPLRFFCEGSPFVSKGKPSA